VSSEPTSADVAARVTARDARRVRVLTGLTGLLWLAAAAGVAALLHTYYLQMIPHRKALIRELRAFNDSHPQPAPPAEPDPHHRLTTRIAMHTWALSAGAALLGVAVGLLALATLGTVLLLFATRRATLRQIQASLADISAQLGEMRRTAGGPAP
jgi:hypothetical protein